MAGMVVMAGGAPKAEWKGSEVERLIIVGSPRANGRSAALAAELFDACIEDCPDDGVAIAPIATLSIAPCTGCDACAAAPEPSGEEDDGRLSSYGRDAARCVIVDDMAEVRELLDAADELAVVAPVYFSGPSSQFKAMLDRLQPYYWARCRQREEGRGLPRKRPMTLHVVGEGDGPYGYAPLVGTVRAAFACADFALERVLDWVGKIDADGSIVADAEDVTALFVGRPVSAGEACGQEKPGSGGEGEEGFRG